jgi:phosphoesterase family protein
VNSNRRRGAAAAGRGGSGAGRRRFRFGVAVGISLLAALSFAVAAMATTPVGVNGNGFTTTPDTAPQGYTQPSGYTAPGNDGLGVPSGAIKHVWVIVMENHAYESNFTGLDNNDYLSQTLPAAGALLTHYYGTGHSSLDNYLSMTSGQAPLTDDQNDCNAYTNITGTLSTSGSLTSNGDYGQLASAAGPNAPAGDNGCVYPSTVPTLFNQLDAKSVSWKVYAQDVQLTGVAGQNAGVSDCGAPDATPGSTPSASQGSNPGASGSPYYVKGSATSTDQYVAKHNPLPWFQSILSSNDCDAEHLAPVFGGGSDQLDSDLQSESSTPSLSFIVPDNCSNGHDSVCAGTGSTTNNLSGMASGAATNAAEGTPLNNVGGAYASDLFLEHVVPEIMRSPAYTDGGLIAIVWDEAYPQFTYSNDSFVDSTVSSATAFNSLTNDSAGETLFGRSLNWEPSGPNVPNVQSAVGQQMAGGPGFNEYLDRPGGSAPAPLEPCNGGTVSNGFSTMTSDDCYTAGGTISNGEQLTGTVNVSATTGGVITTSSTGNSYGLIAPDDEGEAVTLNGGVTGSDSDGQSGITGPFYVGQVNSSPPAAIPNGDSSSGSDTTAGDQVGTASATLVDAEGNPVTLSSGGTISITLAAPSTATDPLYDAFDPTTGGGDSGAVLLSPYITGGTVSNSYYNHYSLLRSLEDIFNVSSGSGSATGYTGSINVSTGLDGDGHLGYAAQPGLAPFGTDVFTDSPLDTSTTTVTSPGPTVTSTVTQPGSTVTQPGSTVTQPGSTVTEPGSTVTEPGATVTEPGTTRTIRTVECIVPKLADDSLAEAKQLLAAAQCSLGKVSGPGAKHGFVLVVKSSSPAAGAQGAGNAKVALTLALKKA